MSVARASTTLNRRDDYSRVWIILMRNKSDSRARYSSKCAGNFRSSSASFFLL